ncbi:MAG: restriction endonuclease subunit S, partial [Sciscionella sp.]
NPPSWNARSVSGLRVSMSNTAWKQYSVGEVADIFDGPHATPKKTESGPWFLSISSLKQGLLDISESAHLSEEDFVKWTRRVTPQPGDILFSYETRLGDAALMPAGIRGCLGRRMGLLRPKSQVVDARFLLYSYLGPDFQETIRQQSIHGATVDRISINELPSWPISLPPVDEQRVIAELLGALDDKIALNEHIAQCCSDLGSSLYSCRLGQDHSIVGLADVAELIMGQSPPGSTYNEDGVGLPFYQGIRDFGARYPTPRVWCSAPTRFARAGDVLVSVRAPVGTINVARGECAIGRGVAVLRAYNCPHILFQALRADPIVWGPYESEGTVFGAINKTQLARLRISWPDADYATELESELQILDARIQAAVRESEILAKLRDTLLPKLMSGEIRVRDAERLVEKAV